MSIEFRHGAIIPVFAINGKFFAGTVEFGGDLPAMQDGWSPTYLCPSDAGILLLGLRHVGGQEAVWYLDMDCKLISPGFGALTESQRHDLMPLYRDAFERAWRTVTTAGNPIDAEAGNHPILAISDPWVTEYLHAFSQSRSQPPIDMDAHGADDHLTVRGATAQAITLNRQQVANLFMCSSLALIVDAINQGTSLTLPALTQDGTVACDGGVALTANTFLYRFHEERHGLTYFVVASHLFNRVIGIYFPTGGEAIYKSAEDRAFLEHSDPAQPISLALALEVIRSPCLVTDYFRNAPGNGFSFVYCHHHLGHHLWNDLTGVDYLHSHASLDHPWTIHVLGAQHSEMYGQMDHLFPNLEGRVQRDLQGLESYKLDAYKKGRIPAAPTGFRVTRSLREAVVHLNTQHPDCAAASDILSRLKAVRRPVVLIGLRVENRTLVNLSEFCIELIDELHRVHGPVAVVIDGHNATQIAGASLVFTSHMQETAHVSPIQIEHAIADKLKQRYGGTEVEIIDLIGASMASSIFWSCACDYFVTPWGAGLAKYRWIANKEGVVLMNLSYHRHRFDYHIYFSEETMEGSADHYFLPAEFIEDAAEEETLIVIPDGRRNNYRVKPGGVAHAVAEAAKWIGRTPGTIDQPVS
ncbi:hypothetical protein IP70_13415 [alpha proteobacterium AAP38]|nr:hypothetical protein IP70_13415 [alpha proteobacterium AAP38]